ncbi:MAG: MGMT family protein [Saprospiraceae bacterium]|nr:MGMT family protein [Saprospiraceae bacterium]MBK7810913.1 MGMT family protein [Saprospiraceae bacterium]MBK9630517.1 MGMT family protein [Saprospiraceae bacterium]
MKSTTKWKIKMEKPLAPEIKEGPEAWNKNYGGTKMLIPTPRLIESILFQIPKGKIKTLSALREEMAEECGADYACPLTTGIFLRICAEYAEEFIAEGQKKIPPYWRVVRDDGSLMEKFPGGPEKQAAKLSEEGHQLQWIGKKIKKRAVVI